MADRLARMGSQGEQKLAQVVVKRTLLTKEAIVEKISNDVYPHSRDGQTVTDLVDTGTYRASWQESFPAPLKGKVATNVAYALPLEFGNENMPGFYVARDTARNARVELKKDLINAIRELVR
jgi:hypothetical protein